MVERVFLTDTRREVLAGEFEGEDSTLESHKSRIRTRSRMALDELIEVAKSDEIEDDTVFNPTNIAHLLSALMEPSDGPLEHAWQTAPDETDPVKRRERHRDKYQYQHRLHWSIESVYNQYNDQINQVVGPDEERLFLGEIVEENSE